MPPKPCLVCGVPVPSGSRCAKHGGEPFSKAKLTYSKMPNDLRNKVLNRDHHRCVLCGSTTRLEVDHIKPWSAGGRHEASNLRVLCRKCHGQKTAHDGHEAARSRR